MAANFFDRFDADDQQSKGAGNFFDQFDEGQPPEKSGVLRSAGDSAIALGSGLVQGVQMLTNVAGADNVVSQALGGAVETMRGWESPERQAERAERAEKIREAEKSGSTWEEVKAYAGAFADAPIDTTLEALGTAAPTIAGAALTGGGSAAVQLAARAAPVALGAAQGVGAVKGEIHDAVEQQWKATGASDEEAAAKAAAAQAYTGENAGSIAAGGALGALAGGTGIESAARRLAGSTLARGAAEQAAPGIARGAVTGALKEAPMEALQGGQERLAANLAVQGEGFDVPTWQGVAGQAVLEGMASAPLGGGFGAVEALAGGAGPNGGGAAPGSAGDVVQPDTSVDVPIGDATPGDVIAPQNGQPLALPAPVFEVSPDGTVRTTDDVDAGIQARRQAEAERLDRIRRGEVLDVTPVPSAPRPSEQMGLDPAAGPMSAAAALAVDTGATGALQQAEQAVDPETGEILQTGARVPEQKQDLTTPEKIRERLQFIEHQARANGGWSRPLVEERDRLRDALAKAEPAADHFRDATEMVEVGTGQEPVKNESPADTGLELTPPAFDQEGAAKALGSRTPEQLQHLAEKGKPGWKEAAQAEIQRRAEPSAAQETVDGAQQATGPAAASATPAAADATGAKWDAMSVDERAAILAQKGGWSAKSGFLNVVGKRLMGQAWKDVPDSAKARIERLAAQRDESGQLELAPAADQAASSRTSALSEQASTGIDAAAHEAAASPRDDLPEPASTQEGEGRAAPAVKDAAPVAAPRKKPRGLLAKKAQAAAQARGEYFAPGNVVKSYSGHDRVISYTEPDADGVWTVTVRAVERDGDRWVDVPGSVERTHRTEPDARALKAGPVHRAEMPQAQRSAEFPLPEAAASYSGISHSGNARASAEEAQGQSESEIPSAALPAFRVFYNDENDVKWGIPYAMRNGQEPKDISPEFRGDWVRLSGAAWSGNRDLMPAEQQAMSERLPPGGWVDVAQPASPATEGDAQTAEGGNGATVGQGARQPETFVSAPDGSIDFGEITPEMAQAMRRQAGKIRLQRGDDSFGEQHIELRHGKDIRGVGFESVSAFVADAVRKIDAIWKPTKTSQLVVVEAEENGKVVFIELKPSDDGDFYTVNSAFPTPRAYAEKKERKEGWVKLWDRMALQPSAPAAQSPSAGQPSDDAGEGAAPPSGQSEPSLAPTEPKAKNEGRAVAVGGTGSATVDQSSVQKAESTRPAAKIEDFGEKIGGARKDVWSGFKDDLNAVSDEDIASQPLSKIWPAPDYDQMIEGGTPAEVVATIRALRDEIPTKPRQTWKVRRWADQVKTLREFANDIIDGKVTLGEMRKAASENRALEQVFGRIDLYMAVGHAKSLQGVRLSFHHYTLYKGQKNVSMWSVEQDAKATAWSNWPRELATGKTKEEAIAAFKSRYEALDINAPASKQTTFEIYSQRGAKGYWVGKKVGRNPILLEGPFDDIKAARAYKDANNDKLVEKLEKAKAIPSERRDTNEPRVGVDMRNGQDVTPELFAETFGFRGVEFGNWVEGSKRQKDLNEAFDALMDMAAILNVPPKALSLNGELGLAFGARGKGGIRPAKAHYEPGYVVINMTKKDGAGSLGHEWWHALDNYFSRMRGKGGDMMTEALDVSLASRGSEFVEDAKVRKQMVEAFGNVMKAINRTALRARSAKLDERRAKAYWTTGPEMSARAFESFLISKLQDQNASNDYLANIVDEKTWKAAEALGFELDGSYPYPTAGEVPAIRAAFDEFFATVQTRETEKGVALFSFAGRNALTADRHALASAQRRIAVGEDAEAVRQDTGWHRGADGRWRFEISDDQARLMVGGQTAAEMLEAAAIDGGIVRVADVLDHPQLFAAYPHLADIRVEPVPEGERAAGRLLRSIAGTRLQLRGDIRRQAVASVMLHELQHAIQHAEGFAIGGSKKALMSDLDKTGAETYRRLAGEVEARNTQTRQRMTGEQRRAISPELTADVPTDEVVVTFNGRTVDNAAPPKNMGSRLPVTERGLLRALDLQFKGLVKPVRAMLARGRAGKRGGLVMIDSADPLRIAHAFASRTGRALDGAIELFSEAGSINGFYDPKSGLTFLVGPNLDPVTAPAVLLHEMIHGQQRAKIDARAMDMLRNRGAVKDPALRGFLDRVAERMVDAGAASDSKEAAAYIVEQAVIEGRSQGFTMADSRFLGWVDSTLGQRIGDLLRSMIAAVRGWMMRNGLGVQSLTVDDLVGYAMSGVDRAAQGEAAASAAASSASVGRSSLMAELEGLVRTMRRVRGSHQAKAVRDEIVGRPLTNLETGTVATVSVQSWDKMRSQSNVNRSISPQAHMQALGNLDTLFRLATLAQTRPGKKPQDAQSIKAIRHFVAPMPFDGDVLEVRILAKEFVDPQQGNRLYLVEALEIDSAGVVGDDPVVSGQFRRGDAASSPPPDAGTTLAQMVAAVKRGMEADGDIQFSRSGLRDLASRATAEINQTLTAPGKVSWWHKTIGTMYNLAERAPAFKPVFQSAQGFIDDVSHYAADAAERAPKLLPRLDTWRDILKTPISAEDNAAVAKPVFEGTLAWTRDAEGRAVRLDALEQAAESLSTDEKAQELVERDKLDAGMLRAWRGMPADQYVKLVNSRYESEILKPGVVWADDELRSIFKLNDAQIALYREFRAGVDRSLDTMARAEMLRFAGEDLKHMRDDVMEAESLRNAAVLLVNELQTMAQEQPDRAEQLLATAQGIVDRRERVEKLQAEGYAPLSRFGKYTVDVVVDGTREYFGLFETAREANKMADRMRAEFGAGAVTQGTLSDEAFKLFAGITPESLELFGNMLGLDSTGDEAQDRAFQEYLRLTKTNRSALRRLIHRKGIAGFSEDVGRVLASFVYSNARQTAAGLHMGDLSQSVNAIPKEQGELKDVAVKLAEYIKNPQEEAQAIRGLLFAQYLGGSFASAFVNMTQPAAVTFPWLSQHGGAKLAATEIGRAAKDIANPKREYEGDLAAALKKAEEDGVVSPQEVHQLMAQARGSGSLKAGDGTRAGELRAAMANGITRLSVAWGKFFSAAEQLNRRITFIAAYRVAKQRGIASPEAFARRAVQETQFVYSRASKMQWGRGAVGGTLMTFKTYSVAYLELMSRLWSQGEPGSPERAAGRKAVALMLGMLLLMGGGGGLPFMEDAEDLIDGIAQIAGYNFSVKKARQQFLIDTFGADAADFIERGVNGLPGVPLDVSGRLGMGNLVPGTGIFLDRTNHTRDVLELLGPVGDFGSRIVSGTRKVISGDVAGGLLEVSPVAIRNLEKGVDMAATGQYRDYRGYKVLDTTDLEAAFKAAGFQPAGVAKIQDANYLNQRAKDFYSMRAQQIRSKWAEGIYEKDAAKVQEARDMVAEWNRRNPMQPMIIRMPDILRRVREMGKDKSQRIADTAPRAMRQQLREELMLQ